MDPYYIQPGTPVYFKVLTLITLPSTCTTSTCTNCRTLHGFVQSDTGAYVAVIVPSMNNKTFVVTHSALTYDDTPEAVTTALVPPPTISFDDLISQSRCSP